MSSIFAPLSLDSLSRGKRVAQASWCPCKEPAILAVAITGIAGPGGGTPDKPVGLVHFACQRRGEAVQLDRVIFTGDRPAVRAQATLHALQLLAGLLAGDIEDGR